MLRSVDTKIANHYNIEFKVALDVQYWSFGQAMYQAETNVYGVDLFSPMVTIVFCFLFSFRWKGLWCVYSLSQDLQRGAILKLRYFCV